MTEEDDTEKGEVDTEDGERIVIVVDPFTNKASVYNYTTCKFVEIEGKVIIDKNDNNEIVIRVDTSLTLRGLTCKFKELES
jgi:uncharacterized protein involved in tellurium resistance